MKASELIEILQDILEETGDIDVALVSESNDRDQEKIQSEFFLYGYIDTDIEGELIINKAGSEVLILY